jgi:hypothetical protein
MPTARATIPTPSRMYRIRRRGSSIVLIPHLLPLILTSIVYSLAQLLYRPARLKSIQINKSPGSIHWPFILSKSVTT